MEFLSRDFNKRKEIVEQVTEALLKEPDVIFGYIFGSFLDAPSFRDIDISVYVENIRRDKVFDYEIDLSKKIADSCRLPFDIVDVRVLNFAPGPFLNNVFSKGQLLFSKDNLKLSEMIENTSLDALANDYISYQSLKELVPR